jgi:hypothetical protein
MMIPTIHSNGTGRSSLLGELEAAHSAVIAAVDALRQVTVHGRDYYVQPGGESAYRVARAEMDARLEALRQVGEDLLVMHRGVVEQGSNGGR